jgi:hypothetical protein
MKGRIWLIAGTAVGVALALDHVPYFPGAARSLAESVQQLVGAAGRKVITEAADRGAPRRAVQAVSAVLAVLVPGVAALLLVIAAKGTLRLRAVIAVLLVALGGAAYAYQPGGVASGALILAIAVAGVAVAFTGPLVAASLCALAGLIGATFLPRLLGRHSTLPNAPVEALHQALFGTAGSPWLLRAGVLIIAALPFAVAVRLILSD